MKQIITQKLFLVIMFILSGLHLQAQTSKQVDVIKAGTLPSLISVEEKDQITNLTVTGYINGTDFRYIREMAGKDVNGEETFGKLVVLDMSGAKIVGGGAAYYQNHTTIDNLIGSFAFSYCDRLTSVTIPNSVTSIGSSAFSNCTGLISVTIPNSVTSIGGAVFWECTGLTSVTIPNSVTSIGGGVFFGCTGLISVTIPNSVTSIGEGVFYGCSGLTSVTIPNSVTSIDYFAFFSCSGLTSVTIPNSVTSIGEGVFCFCLGLRELYNNNTTPQTIESSVFEGVYKSKCTLYVPIGAKSNYLEAPEWKDFASIVEVDITSTNQPQTDVLKVYTEGESIVVEGVQSGETISIYTQAGTLIQTLKATDDRVKIKLPLPAIYLVKTANRTFKVAL